MGVDDLVVIGRVVGVFGIKGAVKVESLTDFPQRFAPGASLSLGSQWRSIESINWYKGQGRVKFEGINNPEAAEKLRGQEIFCRGEKPKLAPNEFMSQDLVGCEVVDIKSGSIGFVDAVDRGSLYDILIVGEVMIPAIKEFVRRVDLAKRIISVKLIEGMRPGEEAEEA